MTINRPLRVFLCHSSNDKPAVRELYKQLRVEPWIQPWLDEEELYPGQDWNLEIEKAVESADAILVCLSNNSITKEGYVQREIRIVLDYADYKPEGTLYIFPIRLEQCEPPRRLRAWQYADYFEGQRERAFQRLLVSLKRRADGLGLMCEQLAPKTAESPVVEKQVEDTLNRVSASEVKPTPTTTLTEKLKSLGVKVGHSHLEQPKPIATPPYKITLSNGIELMGVPAGEFLMGSKADNKLAYNYERPQHIVDIPYDYWMTRFPVTNEMYSVYVKAKGIKQPVMDWEKKNDHPVASVKWTDAMEYCQWLNNAYKHQIPSGLVLRLPTEAEWEKAARGTDGREFPWGNEFDKNKCNTSEGGKAGTTPVGFYSPQGDSPYGCVDMAGNVWEWTHSLRQEYPYNVSDGREANKKVPYLRVQRGGSFNYIAKYARCAYRVDDGLNYFTLKVGFRVAAAPKLS